MDGNSREVAKMLKAHQRESAAKRACVTAMAACDVGVNEVIMTDIEAPTLVQRGIILDLSGERIT